MGMRLIWSLVIAALVGATAVQPIEVSPRQPDEGSKLAAPHAGLPMLAGRRDNAHDLPLATLRVAPELVRRDGVVVFVARGARSAPAAICVSSRSSRGPPIG